MSEVSKMPVERHSLNSQLLPIEKLEDHFPDLEDEFADHQIYLVRADINASGTFKERGARMAVRAQYCRGARHITTASAGNHARGIIVAARECNLPVSIYVPRNAPPEKSTALYDLWSQHGGSKNDIDLQCVGENFDETLELALSAVRRDSVFIHPFDDPDVIAGQGTLLADIKRTVPNVTDIIVPVGGGGLLAGLVSQSDDERIWGAEAIGSDSLSRTLRSLSSTALRAMNPNLKYGGTAVSTIGAHPLSILRANNYSSKSVVTGHDSGLRELASLYDNREAGIVPLEPTALLAVEGLREILRERKPISALREDAVTVVVGTGHNEAYENLLRPKKTRFATISGYTIPTPPSRR